MATYGFGYNILYGTQALNNLGKEWKRPFLVFCSCDVNMLMFTFVSFSTQVLALALIFSTEQLFITLFPLFV